MKRALVGIMTLAACMVAFAGVTTAAVPCPNDGGSGNLAGVKIALHALTFNDVKACAKNAPTSFGCDSPASQSTLSLSWPLDTRASVYVLALDIPSAEGVKGATFGIDYYAYNYVDYKGIFINAFNKCTELEFPSAAPAWPAPQSGIVLTNSTCLGALDATDPQGDHAAVLGWFDCTAYDYYATGWTGPLQVTPRLYLANPDFQVADCAAAASNPCYPEFAGSVGFGGIAGYSPCVNVVATEPTTWGRLKKGLEGE